MLAPLATSLGAPGASTGALSRKVCPHPGPLRRAGEGGEGQAMPGREAVLRRGGGVSSVTLPATFFIAAREPTSAISRTSSIVRTGLTVSLAVTCGGISDSSGAFAAG